MWRNIEVFIGSGPTRIGSEPSSGDGGSGSGKGSPYTLGSRNTTRRLTSVPG